MVIILGRGQAERHKLEASVNVSSNYPAIYQITVD
jgi:hypothetical protein